MPGLLPIIGDVLQVRYCCYSENQISLNVLHYRVQSVAGVGAPLTDIATFFDITMAAAYKDLIGAFSKYRGVGVTNLAPPATVEVATTGQDGAGTVAGADLPTQVSYLVSFQTAKRGRGFRGRMYPGFPPSAHIDSDGHMNAAGVAAIEAFFLALPFTGTVTAAGGNTTTLVMGVYRRIANGLPLIPPQFEPYTFGTWREKWATQRRRGDLGRTNVLPF